MARNSHKLIVNKALGKIMLLFGSDSRTGSSVNNYFNDVWSFTISSEQWTNVAIAPEGGRVYFAADIDDQNRIYYIGGYYQARKSSIVYYTLAMS